MISSSQSSKEVTWDLGTPVTPFLSPEVRAGALQAYHINTALPAQPAEVTDATNPELHARTLSTPLTASELAGLAYMERHGKMGTGYFQLASTEPQTIGYALADGPAALLAWLYEKLHDWTNRRSSVLPFTDDELLTWGVRVVHGDPGVSS